MREWWRAGLVGALSIRAFGIAAPLLFVVAALLAEGSGSASWLAWFFFVTAAFVAVIIAAQVISRWNRDRSDSLNRGVAVACLVLAGPATIGGALVVGALAGVPIPPNATVGLLAASVLLAAWVLAGGRLDVSLADDAQHREELLREVAREKALAIESARLVELDRRRLLEDVRGMVTDRLVAAHATGGNADDAAAHLRTLVNEAVRPLSHELHEAQIREEELVDQVAMMRIPRAPALWARPWLLTKADLLDKFLAVGVITASMVAGVWVGTAGASLMWVITPIVYSIGLAAIVVLANARERLTRGEAVIAFAAADRASALVRQAAWVTRRRLANTMHSEVQGRILASTLRLPAMSPDEEAEEFEALTQDLHRILGADHSSNDWQVAWERLIEMWDYSIDLTVEGMSTVNDRLTADPVAGAALVAVVSEAVTNAVRHGRAEHVHVKLRALEDAVLEVDVLDDGTSVGTSGTPSLGASTLAAVTLNWRLESLPRGHRLHADIPVRSGVDQDSPRENSEHSELARR